MFIYSPLNNAKLELFNLIHSLSISVKMYYFLYICCFIISTWHTFVLHSHLSFTFIHIFTTFLALFSFLRLLTFYLDHFPSVSQNTLKMSFSLDWFVAQSLSFYLSDNTFISSSFCRIFQGVNVLSWSLFSFSALKLFYFLPVSMFAPGT